MVSRLKTCGNERHHVNAKAVKRQELRNGDTIEVGKYKTASYGIQTPRTSRRPWCSKPGNGLRR